MRKLIVTLALFAAVAASYAQDIGTSLLYEFKSKTWLPVASVSVLKLDQFKLKGFNADLRLLGGVEEARGLVATAIVLSYPLAKQISLEFGGAVRILADRQPSFGLVIGASVKF